VANVPHIRGLFKVIKNFLDEEFKKRKLKNKSYTLRSFARDIKVDASTLSKILKGERNPSIKNAIKILSKLNVNNHQIYELLSTQLNLKDSIANAQFIYTFLPEISEELNSSWLCYAILSLFEHKDFESSVKWISKKLQSDSKKVSRILDLLEASQLIDRKAKNWKVKDIKLTTSPGTQQKAIRNVHMEYIQQAATYLENLPSNTGKPSNQMREHDFSGITMTISKKRLYEAFDLIRDFRRSLEHLLSNNLKPEEKDSVHRINIQLFPLSH
jgi:uncharacterized protein (TIGR02147 family)